MPTTKLSSRPSSRRNSYAQKSPVELGFNENHENKLQNSDISIQKFQIEKSPTLSASDISYNSVGFGLQDNNNSRRNTIEPVEINELLNFMNDSSVDITHSKILSRSNSSNLSDENLIQLSDGNSPMIDKVQYDNRRETIDPADISDLIKFVDDSSIMSTKTPSSKILSQANSTHSKRSTRSSRSKTDLDKDSYSDSISYAATSSTLIVEDIIMNETVHASEISDLISFTENANKSSAINSPFSESRRITRSTSRSTLASSTKTNSAANSHTKSKSFRIDGEISESGDTINPSEVSDLLNFIDRSNDHDRQSFGSSNNSKASKNISKNQILSDTKDSRRRETIDPTDMNALLSMAESCSEPSLSELHSKTPVQFDSRPSVASISAMSDISFASSAGMSAFHNDPRRETADSIDIALLMEEVGEMHSAVLSRSVSGSTKKSLSNEFNRRDTVDTQDMAWMINELEGKENLSRQIAEQNESSVILDCNDADDSIHTMGTIDLINSVKNVLDEENSLNESSTSLIPLQDLLRHNLNDTPNNSLILKRTDNDQSKRKIIAGSPLSPAPRRSKISSTPNIYDNNSLETSVFASALKSCISAKKGVREKDLNKSVVFGSPQVAEFRKSSPTTSFTPMAKQDAKRLFNISSALQFHSEQDEMDEVTADNEHILEEWERLTNQSADEEAQGSPEGFEYENEGSSHFSPSINDSKSPKRRLSMLQPSLDFDKDNSAELMSMDVSDVDNITHTVQLPDTLADYVAQNDISFKANCSKSSVLSTTSKTEEIETNLRELLDKYNETKFSGVEDSEVSSNFGETYHPLGQSTASNQSISSSGSSHQMNILHSGLHNLSSSFQNESSESGILQSVFNKSLLSASPALSTTKDHSQMKIQPPSADLSAVEQVSIIEEDLMHLVEPEISRDFISAASFSPYNSSISVASQPLNKSSVTDEISSDASTVPDDFEHTGAEISFVQARKSFLGPEPSRVSILASTPAGCLRTKSVPTEQKVNLIARIKALGEGISMQKHEASPSATTKASVILQKFQAAASIPMFDSTLLDAVAPSNETSPRALQDKKPQESNVIAQPTAEDQTGERLRHQLLQFFHVVTALKEMTKYLDEKIQVAVAYISESTFQSAIKGLNMPLETIPFEKLAAAWKESDKNTFLLSFEDDIRLAKGLDLLDPLVEGKWDQIWLDLTTAAVYNLSEFIQFPQKVDDKLVSKALNLQSTPSRKAFQDNWAKIASILNSSCPVDHNRAQALQEETRELDMIVRITNRLPFFKVLNITSMTIDLEISITDSIKVLLLFTLSEANANQFIISSCKRELKVETDESELAQTLMHEKSFTCAFFEDFIVGDGCPLSDEIVAGAMNLSAVPATLEKVSSLVSSLRLQLRFLRLFTEQGGQSSVSKKDSRFCVSLQHRVLGNAIEAPLTCLISIVHKHMGDKSLTQHNEQINLVLERLRSCLAL